MSAAVLLGGSFPESFGNEGGSHDVWCRSVGNPGHWWCEGFCGSEEKCDKEVERLVEESPGTDLEWVVLPAGLLPIGKAE